MTPPTVSGSFGARAAPRWPSQPAAASSVTGRGERGGIGIGFVAGDVTVNVGMLPLVRPARSAYLEQVARIAPPKLMGREAELAELAAFCVQPDRGPYVWWRAGPWAGKSALLSTFVLRPPPQLAGRVWLVSFFITARLAAQDTRDAFTTVLIEQLCALTGQDVPTVMDQALREEYLLGLLRQAADGCRADGGRLVLVVDGLDEDRGVTLGADAHSIAGLLPADPPAAMRVIVAGRPNPPVPDDVPDWHPLRDPGIVRLLADSPYARDLHRLGRAELKRLLRGTPVEQDLLGLLTAARGGLSGRDLHELTGVGLVQVEDVLHTVAGRTFTRRAAYWAADVGAEVYLLGHEELQQTAVYYLGPQRLTGYRDRLHAWTDTYRSPPDGAPAWPAGTPEYLLRGYTSLLHEAGDVDRLVALVTDPIRHDRMLDVSGGDTATLTEIRSAQSLLLSRRETDLLALARLSIHRSHIQSRNANIPADLPAVWAMLGQTTRAGALAHSITNPGQRMQALTAVAQAAAAAGQVERAEQIAHTITDPVKQAWALAVVAQAAAEAGQVEQARRLAADAEQIARTISNPDYAQVLALTLVVAQAAAAAGQFERAEQIARTITYASERGRALTAVANAAAAAGRVEQARRLAADAELTALTCNAREETRRALTAAAKAAAAVGQVERAEQIAHTITDPHHHVWALTAAAQAAAEAGQSEQARRLATSAEQNARTITDPFDRVRALTAIAKAAAAAGQVERAEQIARTIHHSSGQVRALTAAAKAAAGPEQARRLAANAEQIARTITDAGDQAQALTAIAAAVGIAGAAPLLGAAFAMGSWQIPLPVMARLWPQTVIDIVNLVYQYERS